MTADDEGSSRILDGNAAAGRLQELFAVDLTAATVVCAGCGRSAPLATCTMYTDAPALVLRCAGCAGVILRLATHHSTIRLDLTGARLLVAIVPDDDEVGVPGT